MDDLNKLAERYVAVWNEPNESARRAMIAALWSRDAEHYTRTMEAHGLEAMESRIRISHDKWVKEAGCVFRSAGNAAGHHGAVKLNWEMLAPDGSVSSVGFDFLLVDQEGRIAADWQFIEA